jgi:hypothetical protein
MGTVLEPKRIKEEADSKDRIEHCRVIHSASTDLKYRADINSEASLVLSRFTKVDVYCNDSIKLLIVVLTL